MSTARFEPGPLAEVTRERTGDRWTLVFTREFRHPPELVWAALTEPAQLREWAPFEADRSLEARGDTTLTMIDGDRRDPMPASVIRVERPVLLEYTWGTDILRWELASIDTGTRLTLRHTLDDREWAPKVAAGWHICLAVAGLLLDGRPVGPIRGRRARDHGWDELNDAYAHRLDPA
jgi:uncharacterized protein YndB with AHSA1/START domain